MNMEWQVVSAKANANDRLAKPPTPPLRSMRNPIDHPSIAFPSEDKGISSIALPQPQAAIDPTNASAIALAPIES